MTWQWNDRGMSACRHGYPHGDCPVACTDCGHRCEVHRADGQCEAPECGCAGWADEDPDESDERSN